MATSTSDNTVIGFQAGQNASGAAGAQGNLNTLIGFRTGWNLTTGSNNIILGIGSSNAFLASVSSGSNNILIGNTVMAGLNGTASNQLNIGNLLFSAGLGSGSTFGTGGIGIGTSSPLARLDVARVNNASAPLFQLSSVASFATTTEFIVNNNGNATLAGCLNYNGGTSGTCLSDERVKQDITPFGDGLQEILGLDPVTYEYNGLAGTPDDGDVRTGLIAQQVQSVAPDLVSTTSAYLTLRMLPRRSYSKLITAHSLLRLSMQSRKSPQSPEPSSKTSSPGSAPPKTASPTSTPPSSTHRKVTSRRKFASAHQAAGKCASPATNSPLFSRPLTNQARPLNQAPPAPPRPQNP